MEIVQCQCRPSSLTVIIVMNKYINPISGTTDASAARALHIIELESICHEIESAITAVLLPTIEPPTLYEKLTAHILLHVELRAPARGFLTLDNLFARKLKRARWVYKIVLIIPETQ